MTDWNTIEHAYGKASDLPDLFRQMTPNPHSEVWGELWSRLCHQGTVYPACFAALPSLLDVAERWEPKARGPALALAGSILARADQSLQFLNVRQQYSAEIDSFIRLAEETLSENGLESAEFIFVLQAWLGFKDIPVWKIQFDRFVEGEFEAVCPDCKTDLFLAVGPDRFFAAEQDYVVAPDPTFSQLEPVQISALSGIGRTLYDMAISAQQEPLAHRITYLFGTAECPHCKAVFSIPKSILAEEEKA